MLILYLNSGRHCAKDVWYLPLLLCETALDQPKEVDADRVQLKTFISDTAL